MSYLTQIAGLVVQMFVSAAVGMAVLVAVFAVSHGDRLGRSGTSGSTLPFDRLHPRSALAPARGRSWSRRVCRRRSPVTRRRRRSKARLRQSPAVQSPRRRPSRTSRWTAAASTTPTQPSPFENPTGLTNFPRVLSLLLIPAAQVFMFGHMVAGTPACTHGRRGDVRDVRARPSRSRSCRSSTARRRFEPRARLAQGGGQSGGNLRTRRCGSASRIPPSSGPRPPPPRTAR